MRRTPILRPLRQNGGTLYVFPSATEDIGLNLNSRGTGVSMSHYALLNLPAKFWEGGSNSASISAFANQPSGQAEPEQSASNELTEGCTAIAADLQNYVFNFETVLLNQPNYNYQEYHTVSERVFWHWLKEKCGIFNPTSPESLPYYFYENDKEKKIVQCFGSIDSGNSLSTEFGMFNETYVNIPSSYGNGPVFFKKSQDPTETNYISGKVYMPSNAGLLEGRDEDNIDSVKILEDSTPAMDGVGYVDTDCLEIVKDISEIQAILQKVCEDDEILINSYDDINIDKHNYFKETEFNLTGKVEFNFNAILLYYSIYDHDDTEKSAYATNLFGVIFLEGPDSDGQISPLTKKMSYKGSDVGFDGGYFGNSYSFRVNIKTMSVYDNTDAVIQDNTTMSAISSVEFSDVIYNLNNAISALNTNIQSIGVIQNQYINILRYYDEQRNAIEDVSTKLKSLLTGSSTSAMNANSVYTNEIRPSDKQKNTIKISVKYTENDTREDAEYSEYDYTPPIVITNDATTTNITTEYKPIREITEDSLGVWEEDLTDTKLFDIINNTQINYYHYQDSLYYKVNVPEYLLSSLKFTNLYKSATDIFTLEEIQKNKILSDVKYINFDAFIPLIINYIKDLNSRISALEEAASENEESTEGSEGGDEDQP